MGHHEPVPDPLLDPPDWAPSWLPTIDDVRGARLLRWLVTAVFVVGVAACVTEGANSPADPELGAPITAATDPGTGFARRPVRHRGGPAGGAVGRGRSSCACSMPTPPRSAPAASCRSPTSRATTGCCSAPRSPATAPFYMYRTAAAADDLVVRTPRAPSCREPTWCPASPRTPPPASGTRRPAPFRFAIEVHPGLAPGGPLRARRPAAGRHRRLRRDRPERPGDRPDRAVPVTPPRGCW